MLLATFRSLIVPSSLAEAIASPAGEKLTSRGLSFDYAVIERSRDSTTA
ncbi:MAG TPA: hypothetical protein V6D25_21285 [Leptolyngbyaceae cyanobacterium]